jgi:hypothetical protein
MQIFKMPLQILPTTFYPVGNFIVKKVNNKKALIISALRREQFP